MKVQEFLTTMGGTDPIVCTNPALLEAEFLQARFPDASQQGEGWVLVLETLSGQQVIRLDDRAHEVWREGLRGYIRGGGTRRDYEAYQGLCPLRRLVLTTC
jgi:hypothetical protein